MKTTKKKLAIEVLFNSPNEYVFLLIIQIQNLNDVV